MASSAHSNSAFRGSCVVQPRHPKTRLPTTAVERKSLDLSPTTHPYTSSDEETGVVEIPPGSRGHRSGRGRLKSRGSKDVDVSKNLSTNPSLSPPRIIEASPQPVNRVSRDRHSPVQRPCEGEMRELSLEDDLFFRNLQALKEENKRALKTLENLYNFRREERGGAPPGEDEDQGEEVVRRSRKLSSKRKTSDEHVSEDSGVSRGSRGVEEKDENVRDVSEKEPTNEFTNENTNELTNENTNEHTNEHTNELTNEQTDGLEADTRVSDTNINIDCEKKPSNSDHNGSDVNSNNNNNNNNNSNNNNSNNNSNNNEEGEEGISGVHGIRKRSDSEMPAESIEGNVVYRINSDAQLSSNSDRGFAEGGLQSDSSGEQPYVKYARPKGGGGGGKGGGLGRRNSYHGGSSVPQVRYEGFAHHTHRDFVADLNQKVEQERHRASESSSDLDEDELDARHHITTPASHVNILPENNDKQFRGRHDGYDVIRDMWNDFNVDGVVPAYTMRDTYESRQEKKRQTWSPAITVQEPFKMTLREEKNKDLKQKKIERIKDELLRKKMEEEAELKKRVVPTPVPPSTYLPMYQEQQQHQQQKKQYLKDISKHILKSTEKPFSFTQREQSKNKLQRSQSMYARTQNKDTDSRQSKPKIEARRRASFKANPIPDHLFDLTWKDKQAEQEEYRRIKRKLRSQELLASSSLPPSMKTRGDLEKFRKPRGGGNKENNGNTKKNKTKKSSNRPFQPQVHHNIPDFEELQRKIELALEERKNRNTPTVVEPFDLHTARVANRRRQNELQKAKIQSTPPNSAAIRRPGSASLGRRNTVTGRDLQFDRRRPSTAVNGKRERSGSFQSETLLSRSRSCSPVYSVTEAQRLRQEHIQQAAHKAKMERIRREEEKKQKQKEMSKLQRQVAKKTAVHDPMRYREKETAEKLATFKQAEKERHREYKQFLKSVEQKAEQRPLLFERESQTNAKRKAQRRYEEILRRAGIDGKTLEAFLEGDKALQRKLNKVIHSDHEDDDEAGEEDITLKSEMGYDVVLKGNNNRNSNSNSNNSRSFEEDKDPDGGYSFGSDEDDQDGENSGYDEDDDDEGGDNRGEEDQGSSGNQEDRNDMNAPVDSDDGSYKAP